MYIYIHMCVCNIFLIVFCFNKHVHCVLRIPLSVAEALSTLADAGGCGKGCWCHCCIETRRCLGLRTCWGLKMSVSTLGFQRGSKHYFLRTVGLEF